MISEKGNKSIKKIKSCMRYRLNIYILRSQPTVIPGEQDEYFKMKMKK